MRERETRLEGKWKVRGEEKISVSGGETRECGGSFGEAGGGVKEKKRIWRKRDKKIESRTISQDRSSKRDYGNQGRVKDPAVQKGHRSH